MRSLKCIFMVMFIFFLGCGTSTEVNKGQDVETKNVGEEKRLKNLEKAVSNNSVDKILEIFNLKPEEKQTVEQGLVLSNFLDTRGKALYLATRFADESLVSEILKKADSNLNLDNFTNEAAEKANAKVIKLFIDHGAHFKPLQLVKAAHDLESVKLLIEKNGLDVNSDWDKITALHSAALAPVKKIDILEYLIKAGADVDAQTKHKETPLMLAAQALNIAAIKALLDAGADKNIKNANGHTASMIAYKDKNIQNFINNYK